MTTKPDVVVLRLGHRPGRDERTTTHVGLTARALGADQVVLPSAAGSAVDTITEVTRDFGGPFVVETSDDPLSFLDAWDGMIAHLTMYGEPVQDVVPVVRASNSSGLLIVVGAEKVPFTVYETADWNIAVTNQPHSEIAALGVFLDRLFEGDELDQQWSDANKRVVPEPAGKTVEPIE